MKVEVERALENYETFFIKKPLVSLRKQEGLSVIEISDLQKLKEQILFEDMNIVPTDNKGGGMWINPKKRG